MRLGYAALFINAFFAAACGGTITFGEDLCSSGNCAETVEESEPCQGLGHDCCAINAVTVPFHGGVTHLVAGKHGYLVPSGEGAFLLDKNGRTTGFRPESGAFQHLIPREYGFVLSSIISTNPYQVRMTILDFDQDTRTVTNLPEGTVVRDWYHWGNEIVLVVSEQIPGLDNERQSHHRYLLADGSLGGYFSERTRREGNGFGHVLDVAAKRPHVGEFVFPEHVDDHVEPMIVIDGNEIEVVELTGSNDQYIYTDGFSMRGDLFSLRYHQNQFSFRVDFDHTGSLVNHFLIANRDKNEAPAYNPVYVGDDRSLAISWRDRTDIGINVLDAAEDVIHRVEFGSGTAEIRHPPKIVMLDSHHAATSWISHEGEDDWKSHMTFFSCE